MKNVLIIGGSYFSDRVFIEELLKDGDFKIFVYNRGRVPLRFEGVTELLGDREDETQIQRVIPNNRWFAVVDFCAYTPDHIEKAIRYLPGSVEHYIFISTTSLYKESWALPLKENAPKLSGPQPELGSYAEYGFNKWLAECKLAHECGERGIAYTSLRPAIIYGKYNYAPRESYFFDLMRDNKEIILPDNELALFSFVWVVDVAKAIICSIGNPKRMVMPSTLQGRSGCPTGGWLKSLSKSPANLCRRRDLALMRLTAVEFLSPFPLTAIYSTREKRLNEFLDLITRRSSRE